MTTEVRCIYCKADGVSFNAEHVIPQAFGSYGGSTMVLNEAVCQQCNSMLGAELDQILSRDSYEALLRTRYVSKGNKRGERFLSRRIWINLPDEDRFDWVRGARMVVDWNTRRPFLCTQVIVRDRAGKLDTFLADEFLEADIALFQDLPPRGLRIVGLDRAEVDELIGMVHSRGIAVPQRESIEPPVSVLDPNVRTLIEGRIETPTWRAIAKIAFNYLAYQEGSSYVLHERFNAIRDFITGRKVERALVRILNAPILSSETPNWKAFEGHLVAYQREGDSLRGKVSLYNSITYDVMLCSDLGLFYSIECGHGFDPFKNRVDRIEDIPFRILLPTDPMHHLEFFRVEN